MSTRRSCAKWSRSSAQAGSARPCRPPPLEPNVRNENDNIPRMSRMQIDLMVNSFAADFARVATLQFTNSVGNAPHDLARHQRRPSRTVA